MVNFRLFQSCLLTLALLVNINCYSAENIKSKKLILLIEKTESILGRPIRADLYGINLETKISDINLSVIEKNFGITIDYAINDTTDKRWPNKKVQVLKFKIYPRNTGTISIPKIKTENVSSKEKTIFVTSGKTSSPSITLQTNTPYEQQQFTTHINILSSEATSRLSINKSPVIDDFDILPLKFERRKNAKGLYELKIGWALTARKNGQLKIKLPPIEYSVSGVLRKKFYFPLLPINIKTLPSYLPPTIPIGKITIQSHLPQGGPLKSNSISYWEIKLSGNLSSSYKLPPILRQVKSNSQIDFLPVNSIHSSVVSANNLVSTVKHSIPFKPLQSGVLDLPKVQLQYFDPSTGKITTLTHGDDNIFVLSLFWKVIIILLIVVIFIYIFKLCRISWKKFRFSRIKREQALKLLENNNTDCINKALKLLIESEYWPKNITVNQWGEYWRSKYQVPHTFDEFTKSLSSCFYSATDSCDVNRLNLQLMSLINNKKRL